MSEYLSTVALPVRLNLSITQLSHEIIAACTEDRRFAFWEENWIANGDEIYRAGFALPPAISKSEWVSGLEAVVATVQVTANGFGQVHLHLKLHDDRARYEGAFRESAVRLAERLAAAGFLPPQTIAWS